MTEKPRKVRTRVDLYAIISRAVEEGAGWGWRRAHKHTSTPSDEAAIEQIRLEVMLALEEVLKFDG